jgi:hypothetical protein
LIGVNDFFFGNDSKTDEVIGVHGGSLLSDL